MKQTSLFHRVDTLPAARGELGYAGLDSVVPGRVLSETEIDHVTGAGAAAGGVIGNRSISF